MKVTAKDVAKAANVSVATVSYVINNGPRPVTEETRQKVLDVIDELGYRPNRLARSLTTGKTNALGIIIPDIRDPFFPDLISGAENVARDRGYSVFLCNANSDPKQEMFLIDLLTERQVDGLMIAGSRADQDELKTVIGNHNAVILTHSDIPGTGLFAIDSFDGGRQIGEYLINLGHRNIRFMEGNWSKSSSIRYEGLIQTMKAAGLPTDKVMASSVSEVSVENGRLATLELLEKDPDMTALVCFSDVLAFGVLQACHEAGKRVPEDLSIVGFNDLDEASRSNPPLTTVRVDRYELGYSMMKTLIDITEKKVHLKEHIHAPVQLITRASCVPPGASE